MHKLKFKKGAYPEHRLPFVGKSELKKFGLSFWAVPRTGGYGGGCITGEALATLYLKHLLEEGRRPGGMLQSIIFDMFDADRMGENDSLSGQVVGFFSELEKYLAVAVKYHSAKLENSHTKILLKNANAGLNNIEI